MFRTAGAVFIALHGIVHWIGFAVPWGLATTRDFAATTSAAWGQLELGETGARLIAVVWLPVLVAFVISAYGIWRRTAWAVRLTAITTAVSLVLCVLASPAAIAGLVINIGVLAVIAAATFRPQLLASLAR
jgi:hypothetical protein